MKCAQTYLTRIQVDAGDTEHLACSRRLVVLRLATGKRRVVGDAKFFFGIATGSGYLSPPLSPALSDTVVK
jgi:hypothetical protein